MQVKLLIRAHFHVSGFVAQQQSDVYYLEGCKNSLEYYRALFLYLRVLGLVYTFLLRYVQRNEDVCRVLLQPKQCEMHRDQLSRVLRTLVWNDPLRTKKSAKKQSLGRSLKVRCFGWLECTSTNHLILLGFVLLSQVVEVEPNSLIVRLLCLLEYLNDELRVVLKIRVHFLVVLQNGMRADVGEVSR